VRVVRVCAAGARAGVEVEGAARAGGALGPPPELAAYTPPAATNPADTNVASRRRPCTPAEDLRRGGPDGRRLSGASPPAPARKRRVFRAIKAW
jgi:hypothetical protein